MHITLALQMRLTAPSIDHQSLSERLGLSPTSSWRVGDSVGGTPLLKHKEDGWVRVIPTTEAPDIAPCLELLLREWLPRAPLLKEWIRDANGSAVVRCSITTLDGSMPKMRIGPGLFDGLHELGAELDIDVLCAAPE